MNIEELMNRYYASFSENDKYIASCIIQHKQDCIQLSIDEFALRYHVTKSSLSRFAQKLALQGYSAMRSIIRLENSTPKPLTSFLDTAIHNYHKMIENMRTKDFHTLFERFEKAERILIFASGYSQSKVASECKRMFMPVQKKIFTMHGHDMASAFTNMATNKDLIFLISLTGESEYILKMAKDLRLRQIPTVSLTRMDANSLSECCDENLYIHSIEVPEQYSISYEITTPYFILIEMLFLSYREYLHSEHPPKL